MRQPHVWSTGIVWDYLLLCCADVVQDGTPVELHYTRLQCKMSDLQMKLGAYWKRFGTWSTDGLGTLTPWHYQRENVGKATWGRKRMELLHDMMEGRENACQKPAGNSRRLKRDDSRQQPGQWMSHVILLHLQSWSPASICRVLLWASWCIKSANAMVVWVIGWLLTVCFCTQLLRNYRIHKIETWCACAVWYDDHAHILLIGMQIKRS